MKLTEVRSQNCLQLWFQLCWNQSSHSKPADSLNSIEEFFCDCKINSDGFVLVLSLAEKRNIYFEESLGSLFMIETGEISSRMTVNCIDRGLFEESATEKSLFDVFFGSMDPLQKT